MHQLHSHMTRIPSNTWTSAHLTGTSASSHGSPQQPEDGKPHSGTVLSCTLSLCRCRSSPTRFRWLQAMTVEPVLPFGGDCCSPQTKVLGFGRDMCWWGWVFIFQRVHRCRRCRPRTHRLCNTPRSVMFSSAEKFFDKVHSNIEWFLFFIVSFKNGHWFIVMIEEMGLSSPGLSYNFGRFVSLKTWRTFCGWLG